MSRVLLPVAMIALSKVTVSVPPSLSSTEMVAAVVQDVDDSSRYFYLEASRRIGDAFKLSIEARGVDNVAVDNPLRIYEDENYLQLELGYYF